MNNWMQFAFGALHWSPDTFWECTLPELWEGYNWWNMVHAQPKEEAPMTREEYDELKENVATVQARKKEKVM